MIKQLKVQNVGSIKEEVTLDFKKGKFEFKNEMITNNNDVNPIAIFGANASGKTIILRSILTLQQIMNLPANEFTLFTPNISSKYIDKESSLKLEFVIDEIIYLYEIRTERINSKITYEKLTFNNVVLERKDNKVTLKENQEIMFIQEINNLTSVIRKIGIESWADNKILSQIVKVYEYFSNITFIDVRGDVYGKITQTNNLTDLMIKQSEEVKIILREYNNFPVYDLTLDKEFQKTNSKKIRFKREGDEISLPEEFISHGMKSHSTLLTTLLEMKKGSLLIVDEFERSLHPFVAREFIENLNKKFDIQLIFSTHNTNLMQSLRPDQIFFSKWEESSNSSKYYKLSEIYPSIREVNNIEKMYYGGLLDE